MLEVLFASFSFSQFFNYFVCLSGWPGEDCVRFVICSAPASAPAPFGAGSFQQLSPNLTGLIASHLLLRLAMTLSW